MALPSVLTRHPRWRFSLAFLGAPVFLAVMYHWLVPDMNWLQTEGLFARPGIGFALWSLLLVLITWGVLHSSGRIRNPWRHLFLIPYGVIAIDIALFESRVTAVVGTLSLLCIYILWLMLVTQKPREQRPWLITPAEFLESFGSPLLLWWGHWLGWKRLSETRRNTNKKTILWIVIGIAAAVPAVFFFTVLLGSADAFIIAWLESITWEVILDWIPRILGRIAIAFVLAGLIGFVLRQSKRFSPTLKEGSALPTTIMTVFMGILSGLFLLFLLIQARALFGGEAFLQTYGLTYSEYAREGFFQMWIAAATALLLSIIVYRLMKREQRATLLSMVLVVYNALTVLMGISSLYRVYMYVSVYDLTVLRVWAIGGIVLVILALIGMLVVHIWHKPWWIFTTYAAYLALAWIATMLSINIEARVAFFNLRDVDTAETSTSQVDLEYINSLSADAVPALLRYPEQQARYCEEAYTNAGQRLVRERMLPRNGHPMIPVDTPNTVDYFLYNQYNAYEGYNDRNDRRPSRNMYHDPKNYQFYEDSDRLLERTFPFVVVGCSMQDAAGINHTQSAPWQRTTWSFLRARRHVDVLAPNIETHKQEWRTVMRHWQEDLAQEHLSSLPCDTEGYYQPSTKKCQASSTSKPREEASTPVCDTQEYYDQYTQACEPFNSSRYR